MKAERFQNSLWIILAVGLVLRLALFASGYFDSRRFLTPDSLDYRALAQSLVERGEFSRSGDARPELFRSPGYPAFIALGFAVSGENLHVVILLQILLDVFLCFLTYRLGTLLDSRRVGLMASAVQAVFPSVVVSSVRLLSESLFTFMFIGALLLIMDRPGTRAGSKTFIAGLLMGGACLVRPVALPLVFILAFFAKGHLPRWRAALLFVFGVTMVVAPWVARNQVRAGYGNLSGVGDYNLFHFNALALVIDHPDIRLNPDQQKLLESAKTSAGQPDFNCLNDPSYLRDCRREGWAIISVHPWAYALLHLKTTLGVFLPSATDVLEVAGVSTGHKGTLEVLHREGILAAIRWYFNGQWGLLGWCVPMILVTVIVYGASLVGFLVVLRECLKTKLGSAIDHFDRIQGGEVGESPQWALTTEPTPESVKMASAQVAGSKGVGAKRVVAAQGPRFVAVAGPGPLWGLVPQPLRALALAVLTTDPKLVFKHSLRHRMPSEWRLLVLVILFFVLIPGPVAHARFQVPIMPLISLLSAVGICRVLRPSATGVP